MPGPLLQRNLTGTWRSREGDTKSPCEHHSNSCGREEPQTGLQTFERKQGICTVPKGKISNFPVETPGRHGRNHGIEADITSKATHQHPARRRQPAPNCSPHRIPGKHRTKPSTRTFRKIPAQCSPKVSSSRQIRKAEEQSQPGRARGDLTTKCITGSRTGLWSRKGTCM